MEFSYFLPVNIQFGWNKVDSVADYVASYGKKALIVTGRTSAKKSGLYDRVVAKLETAHIAYVLFDQVDANPLTTTALEGAALAKSESCDMVIAIGGGSIMDCAKGIAFMAVNDGDINDYIFNRKTSDNALPLIVILRPVAQDLKVMVLGFLPIQKQGIKNLCVVMLLCLRFPS